MKKYCAYAMAAAMLLSSTQGAFAAAYQPGTVEVSGAGFGGTLKLSVEFSESKIEKITVAEQAETPAVGGAALEELVNAAIEKQSADIDAVAGATVTSEAFKDVLNKAIAEASGAETAQVEVKDGTYEGEANGKKRPDQGCRNDY